MLGFVQIGKNDTWERGATLAGRISCLCTRGMSCSCARRVSSSYALLYIVFYCIWYILYISIIYYITYDITRLRHSPTSMTSIHLGNITSISYCIYVLVWRSCERGVVVSAGPTGRRVLGEVWQRRQEEETQGVTSLRLLSVSGSRGHALGLAWAWHSVVTNLGLDTACQLSTSCEKLMASGRECSICLVGCAQLNTI